jgi:glycosyltransferase involved in cell wall biosynthesis
MLRRVKNFLTRSTRSRGRVATRERRQPDLSVIVIVHDMPREAPRTLLSLSSNYQRHIGADDYEVIVVDNGSDPPLERGLLDSLAGNFLLIRIDPAPASPAHAVNCGIAEARGSIIGVMVDGARIASPGMLHFARHGARLYNDTVVATLGWYLGHDLQRWSMQYGYDQAREDALLAAIDWPQDGYRLFDVSTLDESSVDGWLLPISESNALFMRREMWTALGGMDERFDFPGGGLLNLDTFRRAMELPKAELVVLLGEGTFHQFHGGVSTNSTPERLVENFARWAAQYTAIHGRSYDLPRPKNRTYVGVLPRQILSRLVHAAIAPHPRHDEPPLGPSFDRDFWSLTPSIRPAEPIVAELVDLAQNEFRSGRYDTGIAVARLILRHDPDQGKGQNLLSLVAARAPFAPTEGLSAEHHFALGEAYRLLGENDRAASSYLVALTLNPNLERAQIRLSTLRLPGEMCDAWLGRLYALLTPETAIEIGLGEGGSISQLQPPTLAIGVDPTPTLVHPLKTQTHIFPETSDAFFARRGPDALLAGRPLGIGFIGRLHLFEQALRGFMHLEPYCGPRSVIFFRGTIPLNETTQSRIQTTTFHTGDIWKTVLCLRHYRPDLDVFTIATPPTGLTLVTGMDPRSRIFTEGYDEAVGRFVDMPYSDIVNSMEGKLNIVPNDWPLVEARLKARGIL